MIHPDVLIRGQVREVRSVNGRTRLRVVVPAAQVGFWLDEADVLLDLPTSEVGPPLAPGVPHPTPHLPGTNLHP